MSAIITDSLTKVFISKAGSNVAVKDLSLFIKRRTIYGLMGHNGAGKTTTFMLLNTLLSPTSGTALVLGYDLVRQKDKVRPRVGLLTENLRLYHELTVEETLRFFADLYGAKPPIEELLKRFELYDWRKQMVEKLSTGMRKKVAILSACIHKPQLLFLDEPFSGLDPMAMQGLRDFIRYLQELDDLTVIIASHNLKELAGLCDQVGIMKKGHMVVSGCMNEIKEQYGFIDHLHLTLDYVPECLPPGTSVIGERIISVPYSQAGLNEVLRALHQQGTTILDMEKRTAALEDVYHRIYQEESR